MSITNKLNQIKNAIYGKEVRVAIHDAIKECYDEATINHGNANMEVKMARGIYNTLNERLDKSDEIQVQTNVQLSEIANKGTTVEVLERVTKEEIERQIADGTMASLTIEDDSIPGVKLKDNQITPIKTTFFDKAVNKNLFDENGCVDGYYRSYSSGSVRESSDFFYTKNIELEQGDYVLSTKTATNASCQVCFFDSNKNYVSGLNLTSSSEGQPTPTFTMPTNAKYVCFSLPITQKGTYQLEKGTVATDFVDHKVDFFLKTSYLSIEEIKKETQKDSSIAVDPSMNLREIFSGLSNLTSEVTIYLKEGTYDTLSYYTPNEIAQSDFYGLFIPDNVRLVGVGNPEKVILSATFETKNVNVSTINLAGTCHLENLTVVGDKTRYAIHDDFADLSIYENYYYRTIKNCIIKGTDTYYSVAYGSGTRSGAVWMIENTQFINLTGGYAFATHSRYDFEIANDITFKNCDFITKSNYAIKVGGMESGVINKLHFIGCRMNGIEIREEKTGSASGIDYEIDGYGNSKDMLYLVTNTDDKTYSYCFSDESIKAFAYTSIAKGKPVQYANGSVSVLTGSDMNKFYGVAMQTANSKEICIVKRAGMVKLTDIDLEATIGDKIVIQSGSFVVDNYSNDYIGRCTINGYIKLR